MTTDQTNKVNSVIGQVYDGCDQLTRMVEGVIDPVHQAVIAAFVRQTSKNLETLLTVTKTPAAGQSEQQEKV